MKKKVAVSTDGADVSAHFGRCPSFTIAEIEDGEVRSSKVIDNPGHHPGYLPQFLGERGVQCIIAGGMGARAQELFAQCNIQTVLGVQGIVQEALESYAKGCLAEGPSLCKPRSGIGYGLDKTACDHGEDHGHDGCGKDQK